MFVMRAFLLILQKVDHHHHPFTGNFSTYGVLHSI